MKSLILAPSLLLAIAASAAEPVTMKYNGTLGEALQRIAQRGGISLMTSGGDLSQNVHINLNAADPSAAIESLAQAHDLEIIRKGDVFVVRSRQTKGLAAGALRGAPVAPTPPQHPWVPPDIIDIPQIIGLGKAASKNSCMTAERCSTLCHGNADCTVACARSITGPCENDLAETLQKRLSLDPMTFQNGKRSIIVIPRAMTSPNDEKHGDTANEDEQNQELSVNRDEAEEDTDEASTSGDVISFTDENGDGKDVVVIPAHKVVDDVVAYGRTIILEEGVVVRGDAVALLGGDIIMKRGVRVQGDVVTIGGKITRSDDTKVTGKIEQFNWNVLPNFVTRFKSKTDQYNELISGEHHESRTPNSRYAAYLLTFAALFGIGFMLWMFIPNRMQRLGASVREEPLRNAVTGVLALLAAGPVSVLLLVSLIGIPVAFLLWSVMFLVAISGLVVIASELGRVIPLFRSRTSQAVILAKGIAVMLIVFHIPFIGALIFSMLCAIAIGAAIRTRYGTANQGTPILDASPIGTPS